MATVTWTGSVSTTYSTDGNWDTGSKPTSSDDVIIANVTNDCVLTGSPTVNSWTVESGARFNGNTENITVVGENSSGFAIDIDGEVVGTTTNFTITTPTTTNVDIVPTSGNIRDLTINHASFIGTLLGPTTITRNLTITAGELKTAGSNDLTVGGGIKNTGTLTANASTIIITGEIAGFAFDQMGTFNAGTSTVQIGDGSTSTVGSSTHFKSNNCHNLIINQHQDAPNGNVPWRAYTGTEVTIGGNLTVTRGRFYRNTSTQDLTVTGDVDIASVGKLGTEAASGSNTFGSLTINSGGTYQATSGTTTITKASGAGSSSIRAAFCHASGTFTHNNGLFKTTAGNADVEFTSQSETNNPFYDFEATQYAIAATTPWVVLNNMTIANGFQFNGSSGFAKVLGIMKHTGGTYNAGDVSSSTNHFFNHYRLEGGTLDLSNIDITVGSIRNTGGTIS